MAGKVKMIQQVQASEGTKVFASYHWLANGTIFNGFGNYLGEFSIELYRNNPGKFITELQEKIARELEAQLGKKSITVKILFFR